MHILATHGDELDQDQLATIANDISNRIPDSAAATIQQKETCFVIEIDDSNAPATIHELQHVLGITEIHPALEAENTDKAVQTRLLQEYSDLTPEQVTVQDSRAIMETPVEPDSDEMEQRVFQVTTINGTSYLWEEQIDGTGGQPLTPDPEIIAPLRDRFDTMAVIEAMHDGYTPILLVDETIDFHEEGLKAVRQYYPSIKPVFIDTAMGDALDKYSTTLGIDTICLGDTDPDEIPEQLDVDTVMLPLANQDSETVLEQYQQVMPLHF